MQAPAPALTWTRRDRQEAGGGGSPGAEKGRRGQWGKEMGDQGETHREKGPPERGGQVSPGDSVRLEVLPVGLSSEATGF